jgi:putative transposase
MRIRVGPDTRPGIVILMGHIVVTDGAFSDDGAFHPLETWDADAVMKLFRERLLARLIERHAISEELARKLLAWRHPGFSAHVGEAIPFEDKKAIEDVACYMVRAPLSLKKLVYLDGQKAVLYRSRMNPFLGRNFEAMDPLEWLARLADHIPDTGKHRTHFYGFYASRVRASRREKEGSELPVEAAPTKRRCPPSWARLISKVYQADPLVCKGCAGPLKIVAYITDELSIRRILDHLGLSPPEQENPPPRREVVRVPVDDEGREIQAG